MNVKQYQDHVTITLIASTLMGVMSVLVVVGTLEVDFCARVSKCMTVLVNMCLHCLQKSTHAHTC